MRFLVPYRPHSGLHRGTCLRLIKEDTQDDIVDCFHVAHCGPAFRANRQRHQERASRCAHQRGPSRACARMLPLSPLANARKLNCPILISGRTSRHHRFAAGHRHARRTCRQRRGEAIRRRPLPTPSATTTHRPSLPTRPIGSTASNALGGHTSAAHDPDLVRKLRRPKPQTRRSNGCNNPTTRNVSQVRPRAESWLTDRGCVPCRRARPL
jgi:hypothetical protein